MEEIKVENQVDEMLEEPSGEDMLLAQIDAFRDKAKQLQTLISAKERKVKELEAMVRAKEERNNQLQEELAKKQAEADGIAADVETQVDRMMQTLRGSVDDLEQRIQQQVAGQSGKCSRSDTGSQGHLGGYDIRLGCDQGRTV